MDWKLYLFGCDQVEHSFEALVDRRVREQRRDERRLAEQRSTMHQVWARKSCIADARSYRVARPSPLLTAAQFNWKR
jgi:hypothetical protein